MAACFAQLNFGLPTLLYPMVRGCPPRRKASLGSSSSSCRSVCPNSLTLLAASTADSGLILVSLRSPAVNALTQSSCVRCSLETIVLAFARTSTFFYPRVICGVYFQNSSEASLLECVDLCLHGRRKRYCL